MLFIIFSLPQGIRRLLHKYFSIATAKACFLVALLSTTGYTAFAGDWQLKKNSSGIKIYTQSSQNTEFKAIRAEFEAKGNVRQLANLLTDVSRQKNWVYSTSSSAIIKRSGSNELFYYTEKTMPWPLSNRDVVVQMKWVLDTTAGTLTVNSRSIGNVVPEKKGIVRVPVSEVMWKVHTIDAQTIKIEYSAQADPGGTIPAWVTNMFLTKGPYETFVNLRKQLVN